MTRRAPFCARVLCAAALAAAMVLAGCGLPPSFPNELRGIAGQQIHVSDINLVMSDPELTDEERLQRLNEMGIVDEDLIDYIFNTFPR